jgi:hypothetical protein
MTVAYGENPSAPHAERYAVAAARTPVLEGRGTPLPGEPFTEFYSREHLAERRYVALAKELLGR